MVVARLLLVPLVSLGLGACVKAPPAVTITPAVEAIEPSESIPGEPSTISGVVTHRKTKVRLGQALVILQSSSLAASRETQTNENGLYAFRNLPPGTYTIQVLLGQADVAKVTTLPAEAHFRANFSLDPNDNGIGCELPSMRRYEPTESLFSIEKQEARLLGVPPTIIHR